MFRETKEEEHLEALTSFLVPGGVGEAGGQGGHSRHVAVAALVRLEAEPALIQPEPLTHFPPTNERLPLKNDCLLFVIQEFR